MRSPFFSARRKPFLFAGFVGLLLATSLLAFLVRARGLSPLVMAGIVVVAVGGLLGTPLIVKIFTGVETLVFYRDVMVIMASVALALKLLHQPVLIYLDVLVAGAGVFHACGRIGCLLAGCCYGRPVCWGVRYSPKHSHRGFPSYLVGVPLFPVQALESGFILSLASVSAIFILEKQPPGATLIFYVTSYAFGRFFLEFVRGDPDRPYALDFSQPQWISLALIVGIVTAGQTGLVPASRWPLIATAGLVICMGLVALWRRLDSTGRFKLFHPRHLQEIAHGLERLERCCQPSGNDRKRPFEVVQTSLGIQISAGKVTRSGQHLRYYCVSKIDGPLPLKTVRALGSQIVLLEHGCVRFDVIAGNAGIFHLLLQPR